MKAMLEARMVAARIHALDRVPHGIVAAADRITISSHGVFMRDWFLADYQS
jgi:hypothetical protein